MNHIREQQMHQRLLAVTMRENEPSVRLLTRLGFAFERVIDVDGHEKLLYGIDL
jgi:RimJ/RimL family protein N-acetyltransferase